ncbi:MAG: BMP family ABC transporter substrate-binding protein [Pseudomonadota bacterium]|nr:BMP family ABC transporter substrate-binding protein [Pseudomonadota bacterium]
MLLIWVTPLISGPAIVIDTGQKQDGSYTHAALNGIQRWTQKTGLTVDEFEVQAHETREHAITRAAQSGSSPIIVLGCAFSHAIRRVAPQYQRTQFVVLDAIVDQPNVKSITFRVQESSYLVGMLAAMLTKTGTISFIGGMDMPCLRAFSCGYAQGAHAINSRVKLLESRIGNTVQAWNSPEMGAKHAAFHVDKGSDIIFSAAGYSNKGVMQQATDLKIRSIGVDINQNHVHPGFVITSMIKSVDIAVYQTLMEGDHLMLGHHDLGLAEGAVDYVIDDHNRVLITDAIKSKLDHARHAIVTGTLKVHNYLSDQSCPVSIQQLRPD